jgi:hypothetical protein
LSQVDSKPKRPKRTSREFDESIRPELASARKKVHLVPGPAGTGVLLPGGKPAEREQKKNFAQALSEALAFKIANALRADFPDVLPREDGKGVVRGNESPARTLKGVKRLDVNYSTIQLGLGLGVSIKTLNFKDSKSGRYTKNVTRIDNELRAEAGDYHERQPFAVLAALVFMPVDAADDAGSGDVSSFAHAAITLRFRNGRSSHQESPDRFERLYIALYEPVAEGTLGKVVCFDVLQPPPRRGLPRTADRLTLAGAIKGIKDAFYERNMPKKIFAESDADGDKTAELDDLARRDPELFDREDVPDE